VHEKYKKFQCIEASCDFGMWKILGGRQLAPAEAEALIRDGEVGPLDGFRSRLGRAFSAKLKLTDAHEVQFDFGQGDGEGDEAPDFTGQQPLGACPKCGGSVFETPNAYVCERAVGEDKRCDFRSGRMILSRPIERDQMQKLLENGKSDLLQFVSARTKRPFSAFLVRQPDGKVGFEFEARGEGRTRPQRGSQPLRVIGKHPADGRPVELYAGRYGPYVKHGGVNATVPDKDKLDALTLDEAVGLIAAKGGKAAPSPRKQSARKSAGLDVEAAAAPSVAAKRTPRASTSSRAPAAKKPATSRSKAKAAPAARAPKTAKTAKRSGATKSSSSTARKR